MPYKDGILEFCAKHAEPVSTNSLCSYHDPDNRQSE